MTASRIPVLIMDGGLGTTLSDIFKIDISTPLWSAKPIDKEPDTVVEAHLAFLRAGARVILTATYQCAFLTFEQAGYTRSEAIQLMRKAVRLAQAAKSRFLIAHPFVHSEDVKVALSLGPYGGMLPGLHEFDGVYPPPYGPAGDINYFDDPEAERKAEDALSQFHEERLRVFADDRETWEDIDWIAFETVPLRREVRAVRRALGRLWRDGVERKPCWIATTHPGGLFPEKAVLVKSGEGEGEGGDEHVGVGELMDALFEELDGEGEVPVPDAVGINCTGVESASEVVREASAYLEQRPSTSHRSAPWLVLYPNGGWDVGKMTEAERQKHGEAWALHTSEIVKEVADRQSRPWKGIMVGGCCNTGPEEIAALTRRIHCT